MTKFTDKEYEKMEKLYKEGRKEIKALEDTLEDSRNETLKTQEALMKCCKDRVALEDEIDFLKKECRRIGDSIQALKEPKKPCACMEDNCQFDELEGD